MLRGLALELFKANILFRGGSATPLVDYHVFILRHQTAVCQMHENLPTEKNRD